MNRSSINSRALGILSLFLGATAGIAPAADRAVANVRVLHLCPDSGRVDVFVNGSATPFVSSLAFPHGTAFVEGPAGSYSFDIARAGAGIENSELSVPPTPLEGDGFYTGVAFDRFASIKGMILQEDFTAPPTGDFRARVFHAASGVGPVDLLALDSAGNTILLNDVSFGAQGTLTLVGGSYRVGLDLNNNLEPELTFVLPVIAPGTVLNLFAVADSFGAFLLAQFQDGTTLRINPEEADVRFAFDFGLGVGQEGWSFLTPPPFAGSAAVATAGGITIQTSNNTNSFGFFDSPLLELESGDFGTFEAEVVVSTDIANAGLVPQIRIRASDVDYARSTVFVVSSQGNANLAPTPAGRAYRIPFSLLAGRESARLSFDVLNFDGDAANARLTLEQITIRKLFGGLGVISPSGFEVANLDFSGGEANGFTARTAAPLRAPTFQATDAGLWIAGEAPGQFRSGGSGNDIFGFWGLETNIPLAAGRLYRIAATFASDSTTDQSNLTIPAYRFRVNDSSLQSSVYLNAESTTDALPSPTTTATVTQALWYRTPPGIEGNTWTFSFDYLYAPSTDNDASIGVYLQGFTVTEFPEFD